MPPDDAGRSSNLLLICPVPPMSTRTYEEENALLYDDTHNNMIFITLNLTFKISSRQHWPKTRCCMIVGIII